MGRRDLGEDEDNRFEEEMRLVKKFYRKYPEIKYSPVTGPTYSAYGGTMRFSHPASTFVYKQQKLMRQGYTEEKAF